jgi:flagellar biosynthetic protein FliR
MEFALSAANHVTLRRNDVSRKPRDMQFNVSFLPAYGAAFILMFARIGTMVMLLPGVGELSVPSRVRLVIALILTAVLFPLHQAAYTIDLRSPGPVLIALGQELMIGVVLGMTARLTISALQVAGSVIAQQLGLGFVTAVDPTQGQQGIIVGNFLTLLGITMIFATDLHYLVIAGLHDSYRLFAPGEMPVVSDVTQLVVRTTADAFRIGIQLSGPFLVFGLVFNVALGVLSRLMPQMQVYFVAVPLSIMIGYLILLVVVGAMMGAFLTFVGSALRELAPYS